MNKLSREITGRHGLLVLLLSGEALCLNSLTYADAPLTPVLGINPASLAFAATHPGTWLEQEIVLRNETADPASLLEIDGIISDDPMTWVVPMTSFPITIPGDGTEVNVGVRFCPAHQGDWAGTLTIVAPNAGNSTAVPLQGLGDTHTPIAGRLVVKFGSDAFGQSPPIEGPLASFVFARQELGTLLEGLV